MRALGARTPKRSLALIAVSILAALATGACARNGGHTANTPRPAVRTSRARRSHRRRAASHRFRSVHRTLLLGHSVQGRPIRATELGDPSAPVVMVVGCIHGNEGAGIPIARLLSRMRPPHGVHLWVVDDLNPDGHAASTRQNADGVDLNRNFPWHWRPIGLRGSDQYSGPSPLSEPESRTARRLILRIRPVVTIWFHQDERLVDLSGGDPRVERRFARLAGLPVTRLPRFPGSVASWENDLLPGSTAFVVELPPGSLTPAATRRYAHSVDGLARTMGRRR